MARGVGIKIAEAEGLEQLTHWCKADSVVLKRYCDVCGCVKEKLRYWDFLLAERERLEGLGRDPMIVKRGGNQISLWVNRRN